MSGASDLRERAAGIAATASTLRELATTQIASALGRAALDVADRHSAAGREARALLGQSTGLTPPMIDWALDHQIAIASPEALGRLAASLTSPRPGAVAARARLAVTVLAGNVFTAAFRAVALPLLARVPVVAKASSRDDIFPRLLHAALGRADAEVAASYDVVTFEGGAEPFEDALFAQADVVAAYGSDTTLGDIRARLPATTTFVPHGHGIGAVYVPAGALVMTSDAEALVDRIALDVAAFDQRGCLSPHAVWVERGGAIGGRDLAALLADRGLDRRAAELPRGSLPTEVGAAQLQWRGVAAARGELFERDGYAVSWEGDSALRLSPGWRNVSVLECGGPADLGRRLAPLGVHLKALGVAGDPDHRRAAAESLPPPLAPRISPPGEMQTPPIDALADATSPWSGLVRWIDLT